MSLSEIRERKRNFPLVTIFSVLLLLVSALILGIEMVRYSEFIRENENTLSANVRIGGVEVGNLDSNALRERLEAVYINQPLVLTYRDSPILMYPSEIGFTLDMDAMQAAARRAENDNFWSGFWDFLLQRPENDARRSNRVDVALIANYSPRDLEDYLINDISARYDTSAGQAGFDFSTLTFQGSVGDVQLDVDAAVALIDRALYTADPEQRRIELPVTTSGGTPPTMATLRQSIIDYLELKGVFYNSNTTVISVFVLDLESGEEMGILENVPHSATSTVKIGVITNYFRYQLSDPTDDFKFLLAASIICSQNSATNTLIEATNGGGDNLEGLRRTSDTFCRAGASNSFISSKLFVGDAGQGNVPVGYYTQAAITPCPGKNLVGQAPDLSISTRPDPFLQSTAADMGTLLALIYECAFTGGGLRAIYPEEITQTECRWMIELLEGTRFFRLAELGVPEGVTFAHKVGYAGEEVADAGIVFSPGGDYVLVTYLWDQDLDLLGTQALARWDLLADISRIVYNYFNPDAPMTQPRTPPQPLGGEGCVLPLSGSEINLNDINQGRFDENGNPLSSACYDWPNCRPFRGWGQ